MQFREVKLSEGDAFNRVLLDRSKQAVRSLGFFKDVEVTDKPGTQADRSVVEVYANGRVCVTSRAYPSRADSLGVALFAEGGAAEARVVDAWEIGSIWTP